MWLGKDEYKTRDHPVDFKAISSQASFVEASFVSAAFLHVVLAF